MITSKGVITLDKYGRALEVRNQETGEVIDVPKEELLKIADFLDLDIYPAKIGDGEVKEETKVEDPKPAPAATETGGDGKKSGDEKKLPEVLKGMDPESVAAIKGVITELTQDAINLNSAGAVDMAKLNSALKASGLPAVTGEIRDAIAGLPE